MQYLILICIMNAVAQVCGGAHDLVVHVVSQRVRGFGVKFHARTNSNELAMFLIPQISSHLIVKASKKASRSECDLNSGLYVLKSTSTSTY